MYEAHFGLQGRAFDSAIVHDVDVFLGRQQETLIGRFKFALASPDAVVTLSGPAGVGKTTLASAAVRTMSTRLALAWLNSVPTNATELLELLLVELGMNAHRTTRIERLQMWRQYLSELSATESRMFVIAERTEDLAPEVLRALDSLTAADATGCAGANVVLLGRPGLDQFLAAPELDSLRQRIRLRQRLEPFSSAELTDYLHHRIERAGGDFSRVFATDAAAAVHRYSGGVARVANNLCETALGIAATERRLQVTAALIREVAVDLLGLVEPSGHGAVAPSPPADAKTPSGEPMQPAVATPPPAPTPAMSAAAAEPPPPVPAPAMTASTAGPPSRSAADPRPAPIAPPLAAPAAVATAAATLVPPAPEQPVPVAAAPIPAVAVPPPPSPLPPPARVAMPPVPPPARPLETPPPFRTATAAAAAPAPAKTHDFDATATDIPDVSSFDFPVLTDAIEEPAATVPTRAAEPPSRPSAPAPAPQMARVPLPTAAPMAPPAPPSAKAASPAPSAAPTATMRPTPTAAPRPPAPPPAPPPLLAPKAATPSAPPPAAAPKGATPPAAPAAKAPPPPAPVAAFEEDADVLRQTQTMRAISVAKSIDDISSSMAETLFGDAELDLLSAALASAGFEQPADDDAVPQSEPDGEPELTESDDIMDLFNLGPDAPLELIDDSAAPPSNRGRKTATRR